MTWRRVAGRGTSADGNVVGWSMAEGSRGSRWRESSKRGASLVRSVLVEVTREGTVSRLEVDTVHGALTLHPAPDAEAIHGNVVTLDGVRHLTFPWSGSHVLLFPASPVVMSVALDRLASVVPVGSSIDFDGLHIDDALVPTVERWVVERETADTWRLRSASDAENVVVRHKPGGSPALADAKEWPLET